MSMNTRTRRGLDLSPTLAAMADWDALYRRLPLSAQPHLRDVGAQFADWLAHPGYDAYWRALSLTEAYDRVTAPNLQHAGWFDIFLQGNLTHFAGMKARGGSTDARRYQKLVIGPWVHAMTADTPDREFGGAGSYQAVDPHGAHLRWFSRWLKGEDNGIEREKPVKLFVMGRDQWREEDDWPLPGTQYMPLYLRSDGRANATAGGGALSTEKPGSEPEDVFLYDPRNPVPTHGGWNFLPWPFNAGPRDQRALGPRGDVLCYTAPPQTSELELTGPLELVLYVASSAPDTDFTAKLIDVFPDGRALLLADGIRRMRYRDSLDAPTLLTPGRCYEVRIDLIATSNVFRDRASHPVGDLQLELSEVRAQQQHRRRNCARARRRLPRSRQPRLSRRRACVVFEDAGHRRAGMSLGGVSP